VDEPLFRLSSFGLEERRRRCLDSACSCAAAFASAEGTEGADASICVLTPEAVLRCDFVRCGLNRLERFLPREGLFTAAAVVDALGFESMGSAKVVSC
jgi:hypothetical protein